jgi:hypothetical protein
MGASRDIDAVKESLSQRYLQDEPDSGVVGVGLGKNAQGQDALIVHLDGRRADARARVLSQAEGHPVEFVEQGTVSKQ